MKGKSTGRFWWVLLLLLPLCGIHAGTLPGFLRDQNWFARYQSNPFGVGYYEFAINANALNNSSPGGGASTDVFGSFQMPNLPAGTYTVASWDVWWRSAYAFNVVVPASGAAPVVDMRLNATMWGYPAFWDDTGYYEFGQTFVATGAISMIYLRCPFSTSYTLTVHEGGPGGPRVGLSRTFGGGDQRLVYGYGDMPTVGGRTYYARIRTSSPSIGGVIMQMDPRPDFSDPMPGGCLWLGNSGGVTPYPDRDLGLIILSDDDGLLTNLYTRQSGGTLNGTSVGQTFIARGVNLISAAAWLADASAPTYVVRILQNGPGGAPVGTTKRGRPARLSADPQMIVTWAPGECPLAPGQTYYLEITRDGGGSFNSVYVNTSNPYPFGQAYRDGVAVPGTDLAGTLMEEASEGSATRPGVKILSGPAISDAGRGNHSLTIEWTTDVPANSRVEYAPEHPPYSGTNDSAALVTSHSVTLTGLQSHTMYHFRVSSFAEGFRPAVSRDMVICTRPSGPNLLTNPGFEGGSGASPQSVIPGWTRTGNIDIKVSNGTWFYSIPPRGGGWFLQGAVNGSASDGTIYQRVTGVLPGREYTFSAWVTTWPRENGAAKYDVWNSRTRLIYMRLGIDPTGGANPASSSVQWTPRMYSHRHYTPLGKTVRAHSTNLTVFVSMKGDGVEWHLYGVDDCVLSDETIAPRLEPVAFPPEQSLRINLFGKANRTNLIERSTDLETWMPWTNLFNFGGMVSFEDASASQSQTRFYRARQQ
jgi:hypothetical protein